MDSETLAVLGLSGLRAQVEVVGLGNQFGRHAVRTKLIESQSTRDGLNCFPCRSEYLR